MKTLGLFAAGILVGMIAIVALNFEGDENAVAPADDTVPLNGASEDAFDAFRRDVDARLAALEREVGRIGDSLQVAAAGRQPGMPVAGPMTEAEVEARREAARARILAAMNQPDRLLAAGFTQDRIDWAERRIEQVTVEVQQARYQAQRNNEALSPAMEARYVNPMLGLRDEMADAEFERYLAALGRPTSVGVTNVLASSSAEVAGVRAGDEIVSYDGKRVFTGGELNAFATETPPGRSVTMEVRRNGQPMQLVVPAGPLGVTSNVLLEAMGDTDERIRQSLQQPQ